MSALFPPSPEKNPEARSGRHSRLLVVTPTLGRSAYLQETVDCVRALGENCEHVLVAPASVSATLQARFPDLTIVSEQPTGGMYGALNDGLQAARNDWEWFTYLNDDDRLELDRSTWEHSHAHNAREVVAYYCPCWAIDAAGRTLFRINVAQRGADIADLFHWRIVALNQQGLFFSRAAWERVGKFDASFSHGGDMEAVMRALNAGVSFRYFSDGRGFFRVHGGQLSKDAEKMAADFNRALAGLHVGHRFWLAWLRFRLGGLGPLVARILRLGFRRTHTIYETEL